MKIWTKMTEVLRPIKGFRYECEDGHEWFVELSEWDQRGDNNCPTCTAVVTPTDLVTASL